MFNEEIKVQIKNFKNGAAYNKVKDNLQKEYNETDAALIAKQAFNKHMRIKANRFIVYAAVTIISTCLYHFLFEKLSYVKLIAYVVVAVILAIYGMYIKYKYSEKINQEDYPDKKTGVHR